MTAWHGTGFLHIVDMDVDMDVRHEIRDTNIKRYASYKIFNKVHSRLVISLPSRDTIFTNLLQ
jgi:hypothetical protein